MKLKKRNPAAQERLKPGCSFSIEFSNTYLLFLKLCPSFAAIRRPWIFVLSSGKDKRTTKIKSILLILSKKMEW